MGSGFAGADYASYRLTRDWIFFRPSMDYQQGYRPYHPDSTPSLLIRIRVFLRSCKRVVKGENRSLKAEEMGLSIRFILSRVPSPPQAARLDIHYKNVTTFSDGVKVP